MRNYPLYVSQFVVNVCAGGSIPPEWTTCKSEKNISN